MELAHRIESRRAAFFYFGTEKKQMLGVWEVKQSEWTRRHFAFGVTLEELLNAPQWLKERGIEPRESFGLQPIEPIVHTWMPAAAVYFNDPDGNSLEFITMLEGKGRPELTGVRYLSEWEALTTNKV
jgi:lactoylglutathione lyase